MSENYDMNNTERIAYVYLQSLGYRNIKYNKNISPDFETSDGKGWEVKPYPNYQFTDNQFMDMDYNSNIIFVDKNKEIFVAKFYEVCENSLKNIYIGGVLIYSPCWRPVIEDNEIIYAFAEPLDEKEVIKILKTQEKDHWKLSSGLQEKVNKLKLKTPRPVILIGK